MAVFGSDVRFRTPAMDLSLKISKREPFLLHFNCAVVESRKSSLYACPGLLKPIRVTGEI